jgi:glycosylphosphatidylinositol transamidase (GPIT) subunit GPI8
MFSYLVVLLALSSMAYCQEGVNWAVLIAGSNGYFNYRHQVSSIFNQNELFNYKKIEFNSF